MKRTIIRGVSALLLVAASVAGAESTDSSPVEVLKENRLSYTDGFVDAVKVALDALPAQPQPPATGKPCDWSVTASPDPHNAQFLAFAGSQQLKYEVALIGYDVYDKARLNAKDARCQLRGFSEVALSTVHARFERLLGSLSRRL